MTDQPHQDTGLSPNATEFTNTARALSTQDADNPPQFAEGGPVFLAPPAARLRVVSLPARPDGTIPFLIVFDRCTAEQAEHLHTTAPVLRTATGAALVLVFGNTVDLDNAEWDEETTRKALGPNLAHDILTGLGRWSS
ncbi:hypothetical protein [Nocardia asiatica]|uniref:hypothetical protein n=1 Tax=Nocardia asiatica TaxID=209252 RepID=UPI002457C9AE|nr:hypothetical protein [Nocardia asiatica]